MMPKVAIMSVADMGNYGDMLFPFVVRQEILRRMPGAVFRFFTPTSTVIEGEQFYGYSRNSLQEFAPNVILLAGGEVIHPFEVIWERVYANVARKVCSEKVSDTFFDWLDVKGAFKAWLSVGVIKLPFEKQDILSKLDYVGVRGVLSKKILEEMELLRNDKRIRITPDLGWMFDRYSGSNVVNNVMLPEENSYLVCNVNATTIDEPDVGNVRRALLDCATSSGLGIVEFPQMYGRHVGLFRDSDMVLRFNDINLETKLKLLERCRLYFGSSLHCAISALANGKPAGVIHKKRLTKFQDLFGHLMMIDRWLSDDWSDSPKILSSLLTFNATDVLQNYTLFLRSLLDNRFDELCQCIEKYQYGA